MTKLKRQRGQTLAVNVSYDVSSISNYLWSLVHGGNTGRLIVYDDHIIVWQRPCQAVEVKLLNMFLESFLFQNKSPCVYQACLSVAIYWPRFLLTFASDCSKGHLWAWHVIHSRLSFVKICEGSKKKNLHQLLLWRCMASSVSLINLHLQKHFPLTHTQVRKEL